jgi:hypothetical protein
MNVFRTFTGTALVLLTAIVGSAHSANSEPSNGTTMDLRLASPSVFASSVTRINSSGLVVPRKTFSATLPNNQRFIPE